MLDGLRRYFGIDGQNTTLRVEVLAGLSTFLSLSYIFVVNPAILAQAGMDRNAVLFATVIASATATLVMALWARLPFVLAPGMEINAYVAFFVVGSLGYTWQQALGAIFWSGVLFVVLTLTRVRERIIEAIPDRMKTGLSLCVGVFLGLVALKIAGLLRYEGVQVRGFGDLVGPRAWVFYGGLATVLVLERLKIRADVLLTILLAAALCRILGIQAPSTEAGLSSSLFAAVGQADLSVLIDPKSWSIILILFLVDFYGSVAKFIGLTMNTPIVVDGKLPRLREALLIDGGATLLGSGLGTSTILVYVESGVGIAAGGRTGLTALVCGILMLLTFAVAPLLQFIPVEATTGVLAFVGVKLCPPLRQLKSYQIIDFVALAVMQIIVVATFAIDRAMLAGFFLYLVADLFVGRRPNPYLIGSTILLAIGAVLQSM